jgi:AP-1 complex subunit beta-1
MTNSEINDLTMRIQGQESKDREFAYKRLLTLECQNVDCSQAFPAILGYRTSDEKKQIFLRRFTGVFTERYLEAMPNLGDNATSILLNDFERPDPQLKGIIVRQIGRIANDANIDKLIPVVMRACSNDDPYVRKAAALSILSIHQSRSSFIEKFKLGAQLKRLVEDSNPNVAANAVSALLEINNARDQPLFLPTYTTINNLLASIDQSTEWAQVQILDFACSFKPENANDARGIISRVSSRLAHANAAVVLSAIRCSLQMNMYVDDPAKIRETLNRVALPLVTLLNNTAPIQYVAVKSILILLQNYRRMLSSEVSIFFCKFDDPSYIKLAKLDVILTLASAQNVGKVLEELYDYSQQADVDFVRKSISAIGKIAVNFENAASSCVDKIVSLVKTKVPYVIQECIVVSVDIFRRYPLQYLGIVGEICAALTSPLDDHRAKAAMIWILGEYCDRIDNAGDLIDTLFLDDFLEDTPDVQLSLLTAVFKYFLVDSEDGQDMFQRIITMATSQVDSPDIRDRAFMYYYLLSEHPDEAHAIIKPEQPFLINTDLYSCDADLVKQLIPLIGTIAILYGKTPDEFVENTRIMSISLDSEQGLPGSIEQMDLPILVSGKNEGRLEVRGALQQIGPESSIILRLTNYTENSDEIKNIAFNKNIYGFAPGELPFPKEIPSQKSITCQVPITYSETYSQGAQPAVELQIAILTNSPTPIIFSVPIKLETLLKTAEEGGKFTRQEFMTTWQQLPAEIERTTEVQNPRIDSISVSKTRFTQSRLFFNAKKENTAYFSGKTMKGELFVVFLTFAPNAVQIGIRLNDPVMSAIILQLIATLVK